LKGAQDVAATCFVETATTFALSNTTMSRQVD
jgi:hypothetical protein